MRYLFTGEILMTAEEIQRAQEFAGLDPQDQAKAVLRNEPEKHEGVDVISVLTSWDRLTPIAAEEQKD